MSTSLVPGFLAVSGPNVSQARLDTLLLKHERGQGGVWNVGTVKYATWGIPPPLDASSPIMLCSLVRRHEANLDPRDLLHIWDIDDGSGLAEVLSPFAAVRKLGDGIEAVTDVLGFRHIYYGESQGIAFVTTSSLAAAELLGAELDLQAVAVQSRLGWQVGDRTLYKGIQKLAAGHAVLLNDGAIQTRRYAPGPRVSGVTLEEAVSETADVLRKQVGAYLEDHPDSVLQLSGGQDSRLLLSAIAPHRRREVRAMTLGFEDDPNVVIACRLAAQYGMKHELISLDGLASISPEGAYHMALHAARRLDFMADPLAFAALDWVEARMEQGPRLSGVGGEFTRGNYYFGPPLAFPVARPLTALLADWRLFAHESAGAEVLDASFDRWAHDFTVDELHQFMQSSGHDWWTATDEFYLTEYLRRWAGVRGTATCFSREEVRPLLDDRVISIARGLRPADKGQNLFVSRLQAELDPDLARIPLDGRLAPVVYTERTAAHVLRRAAWNAGRVTTKVKQKVRRRQRPHVGTPVLARKVVEYWRQAPTAIEPVKDLRIIRPDWVDDVVAGKNADPSSVALVVNLSAAISADAAA